MYCIAAICILSVHEKAKAHQNLTLGVNLKMLINSALSGETGAERART
jgi:hypothetical protein